MIHEDVRDMDVQEYAMSGLETRDQQEAEAAAEAAEDDYTFRISKSEFVHHIADAYKSGYAAGQEASKLSREPSHIHVYLSDNPNSAACVSCGQIWDRLVS